MVKAIREQVGIETYQVSVHEHGLREAEFLAVLTPAERAHVIPLHGMMQSHVGHFPEDDGLFALIKLPFNTDD